MAVQNGGSVDSISTLDPSLCADISFFPFTSPPPPSETDRLEEWAQYLETIDKDLHHLLRLPHRKFWAQVLHDKSLHRLLDTYLQHAPRPYERVWPLPVSCQETLRTVHKRVFFTLLRMSTHHETKDSLISPSLFGELLYNHYLFDIPRLLDLCSVYGESNPELVGKMVHNVFDKQPKYWEDLKMAMKSTKEVLHSFTSKCSKPEVGLLETVDELDSSEVVDMIFYFADISHSLKSLTQVYPTTCRAFWDTKLLENLVSFFESNVPVLKSQWKHCKDDSESSLYIAERFKRGLKDICDLIHTLIMNAKVVEKDEESGQQDVDAIVAFLTHLTSEKIFLKEFEKHHSLRDCLHCVKELHPSFNDTHVGYILSAVGQENEEEKVKSKPHPQGGGAKESSFGKKVKYIKELLPHLDEEFIKKCLKEFNNDPQIVVDRVLEEGLPPHLLSSEVIPPPPTEKATPLPKADLVDSRAGVYDYDEFDMMHSDRVDLSRIHIGKRHQSTRDILSDKSHVSYMKGRGLDLSEYDEYDDEYDDTYDSQNVGATDQDSADELLAVKRLNEKGQFSSRHQWEEQLEEEEENAEQMHPFGVHVVKTNQITILKRNTDSSTNQQKQHNKEQSSQKQRQKERQTKGVELRLEEHKLTKAERKDQKQQEERKTWQEGVAEGRVSGTQHYRQYKERNKGFRANHNRRAAADKKRKAF